MSREKHSSRCDAIQQRIDRLAARQDTSSPHERDLLSAEADRVSPVRADVRTVRAAVGDEELVAAQNDFSVTAGNDLVFDDDVAVRIATDR